MRMPPHMALGADPHAIKGATVSKGIVRRVLVFARPYRLLLVGFLITIVLEALIALVPVLLFKQIIDIIPTGDRDRVTLLAGLVVARRGGHRRAVVRRALVVVEDR